MLEILIFLAVLAITYVLWDLGKRHLALTEALKREAVAVSVQSALAEYVERNDKILTNFLTQMRDLHKLVENERQTAKGSALNNNLNGRWRQR